MATGYDARPGGRRTFTDQGVAPIQIDTGASANSRGAQVVGGETIGGVQGGQYSQPGDVAAGLGAYFERFMEPAVKRKQQEQFFKGYTEAQSGKALKELTHNGSPLTKIFGPSGFAQGAQFYHGQAAIDKWTQAQLADRDNLKRLPPDELSKHMADTSQAMLTGDPYADQMIQSGLLEAQGPVIQTLTRDRVEWQQREMGEAMSSASSESARALQGIAKTNFALGEKADTEAIRTQAQRFLGGMSKPEGMTDDNYQKFLYGFMRRNMSEGNFYAVELLRARGVDSVLTEDQQRQIEDGYQRYGARALDEAASEPDITDRLLRLDARVAQVEMEGGEAASTQDVVDEYRSINSVLRQRTGVDKDFFDAGDIRSAGGKVMSAIVSRFNRLRSRAEAIEDRDYNRNAARQDRLDEAAEKLASVRTAWSTGNVTASIAAGMSSGDFDTVAMQDFSQGNYGTIARAYVQSGWKSNAVSTQVQAMTRSGIGDKYTEATKSAYGVWKQFHDTNPELSAAYFGEYDFAFNTFDRMQGVVGPEVAHRDAFARVGGYGINAVPPAKRREAEEQLKGIVASRSHSWVNPLKWGNYTLTGVSQNQLVQALTDEYARIAEFSPRDPDQMAQQAFNQATNSGRWEQYGHIGWLNTKGGKTIGQALGLHGMDAAVVVEENIKAALGQVGIKSLDSVRVIRTDNNLTMQFEKDGVVGFATLPFSMLQQKAAGYVARRRERGVQAVKADQHSRDKRAAMEHAERRVPGETTLQRVIRINRENAEWAARH